MDWTATFIDYLERKRFRRVEAQQEAEDQWAAEIKAGYEGNMIARAKSWFTGYNSNVDGHDRLRHMMYLGGSPAYRAKLAEVASRGYEGFDFA